MSFKSIPRVEFFAEIQKMAGILLQLDIRRCSLAGNEIKYMCVCVRGDWAGTDVSANTSSCSSVRYQAGFLMLERSSRLGSESKARRLLLSDLGFSLGPKDVWLNEQLALSHLRPAEVSCIGPTTVDGRVFASRHLHVVGLVPSPDAALLAIATSDARLEIHQPGPPHDSSSGTVPPTVDSFRLRVNPARNTWKHDVVSSLAWYPQRDIVAIAMRRGAQVWLYDIERCIGDEPTRTCTVPSVLSHGVNDLKALECSGLLIGSSANSQVFLLDQRKHCPAAEFEVPTHNNAIAVAEPLIFVCGNERIDTYDLRMLQQNGHTTTSGFSTSHTSLPSAKPITSVHVTQCMTDEYASPRRWQFDFNFVKALDGGARIAFQLSDGTVGIRDIIAGTLKYSREKSRSTPNSAQTLRQVRFHADTTTQSNLSTYPWYASRRYCSVVNAPLNSGWRMVVPCLSQSGFRIVPLNLLQSTSSPLSKIAAEDFYIDTGKHVTCIHAEQGMRRVVVGYDGNSLDVFHGYGDFKRVDDGAFVDDSG